MIMVPNFHSSTMSVDDLDESLVLIEMRKSEVTINKFVEVGMCALDWSKTKLHRLHYDYSLPKKPAVQGPL